MYDSWGNWGSCIGSNTDCFTIGKKNRTRNCVARSTKDKKDDIYCVGTATETVWCEIPCKGEKKLL